MSTGTAAALADIDGVIRDAQQLPGAPMLLGDYAIPIFAECIRRLTPAGSEYRKRIDEAIAKPALHLRYQAMLGAIHALRADILADRLKSFQEIVHADLFSDFVEMSRHLLAEGYKDAAAVVVGSTLESHLRQLCGKLQIATNGPDGRPLKADRLNADLGKLAYNMAEQKQITAWLDLRNNAAHGHYSVYVKEQVALMIDGIANFMARNPA